MSKILLVEDNEMNRDMLKRRLERNGFEVVIAVDHVAAMAAVQAERPDLILMDISLPGKDGYEITRELKGDAATAEIPIIALTASAMASDRDKAMMAGCDDYDTKPVDMPRLLGKIRAQLDASVAAR